MKIAIPNCTSATEKRVALTPNEIKRLKGKYSGLEVFVMAGAGEAAHYSDAEYTESGAEVIDSKKASKLKADVTLRVTPVETVADYEENELVIGLMDPAGSQKTLNELADRGVNVVALERIPRTSRAQAMDALSSQANIGGYRAVLEATQHFDRYFPLMMTSAGSAKPAKVVVMGAGVAGLQAIATARRLGAQVEAFDIRPEVKEQIESLGAKFIEFDLGEEGSGEGGYAKELSEAARKKQQALLQAYLTTADVVITTAQIPGRPAPVLVTEEAVKGMRVGSVIVDMAAASGGNCPLTEADKVVVKHGVKLVGHTNYASMLAHDASSFYARNLANLLELMLEVKDGVTSLHYNLEDDIIAGSLVVYGGQVRL
ncbi:MAG: Re/Si-specific NAD(P)(+) transhydrogenase subunit alpha [Alphaproteobacteria bacterium]|nr:Re/Si-specific NAD(P)(+) transhydrogenase subunit alpha [Alphaproteobacteria bacterium]MDD9920238.1 Re/Si-specific NAD(P)(+) transhydrogenase subunit alpha [Alphaproteobacteria bacterium]